MRYLLFVLWGSVPFSDIQVSKSVLSIDFTLLEFQWKSWVIGSTLVLGCDLSADVRPPHTGLGPLG